MAKSKDRLILVSGATGQQGGAVLRRLRDRGFAVRALTRDPERPAARALAGHGTELVRGDLSDPASLTRALDGAYGVYSVQTPMERGVEAEVREGINLADAAKRQRVSHLVYSSVAAADQRTGIPFFDSKVPIEEHIRGTGLKYTIFRPAFFMENLLAMKGMIEQGAVALPLAPETRLQMIAVDDIGALVAMAFERSGHWQGRTMEIAGDELSMSQIAQALSRFTGREVQYRQAPWEQFEQQAGPAMTRMWRWIEEVGLHVDIPAVRQEYPKLMTFDRWLRANWGTAAGATVQRG